MTLVRKLVIGAAVALSLGAAGSAAQAAGWGCSGPFCNQPKYPTLWSALGHGKQPLPTFQAAPWYLYWPYDAHFLTPAPVHAPYYAPPGPGNFPVNPYFPGPAGMPYGPIPGGPPPAVTPYPYAPGGYPPPPGFGTAPPPPAGMALPPVPGFGPPPPAGAGIPQP